MWFCETKKPLVATAALLCMVVQGPVAAFELLTVEEIAAVSQEVLYTERQTAHPLGPRIIIRSPDPPINVITPFDIEITFSAQGEATIDPNTLNIRYGWIDITQRILESGQAEINSEGLKVRDTKIQQGTYQFTISVADDQGRIGITRVRLVIMSSPDSS